MLKKVFAIYAAMEAYPDFNTFVNDECHLFITLLHDHFSDFEDKDGNYSEFADEMLEVEQFSAIVNIIYKELQNWW